MRNRPKPRHQVCAHFVRALVCADYRQRTNGTKGGRTVMYGYLPSNGAVMF